MILSPYGRRPDTNRTAHAEGSACPRDPYHYQEGEAGYYSDTPLGDVPNDFALSPVYQYTPVHEGWTNTNQGQIPGGIYSDGLPYDAPYARMGLAVGMNGLRDAATDEAIYRRRTFAVQAVTAVAVVASALFAIYRTSKQIQYDKRGRR